MGIRDLINFLLRLIIQVYVGGVFTYILLSVGSDNSNYLLESLSPLEWLNTISSGYSFLYIFGLIITFFISFNRLLKTKVDYWYGSWWYKSTRWWWDDWF